VANTNLSLTLFLSGFLLFWFQPMVAKMVLPLFGGSVSVWTTCVLFFQTVLLAGYVYAHLLAAKAPLRVQFLVHGALMLATLAFLPIRFAGANPMQLSNHPALSLLLRLSATVGIPFFAVSATAPLLQHWLSRTNLESARDPYFLYVASNAGCLLALLTYPVLFEPLTGLRLQTKLWTGLFGLLIVMIVSASVLVWKRSKTKPNVRAVNPHPPTLNTRVYWLAAAFVPSALMLAVTNHITMDIISVPFLWVVPLAVYLLTFMLAFAKSAQLSAARYARLSRWSPLILLLLLPIIPEFGAQIPALNTLLIAGHVMVLFFGAYICHTFLAARRPDPKYLTGFYFCIALGGAMGGAFVAIIAPQIFRSIFEYPLLVAALPFFRDSRGRKGDRLNRRIRFAIAFAVLLFGYITIWRPKYLDQAELQYAARNFFGLKRVLFRPDIKVRELYHGDTLHGVESTEPALDGEPLTYYHRSSPAAEVMDSIAGRPDQKVGVVGLGVGSMAAYAGPTRHVTFFEVDPQVEFIARVYFTHLRRCGTNCDVVISDGRVAIQKMPINGFDVLMLDAFNSDSIPPHLVSREAIQLYLTKLKPQGLLLFHTSSRYLDVASLVAAATTDAKLVGFFRRSADENFPFKASSDYIVAARHIEDFGLILKKPEWLRLNSEIDLPAWTDDYSNMMALVRWW
jgi:spermidine synthase